VKKNITPPYHMKISASLWSKRREPWSWQSALLWYLIVYTGW